MVKVKVCGITNLDDARCAIDAGADYVGLIFAQSSRSVIKGVAKKITDAHPDFHNWVGVFMNGKKREIEAILDGLPINILQFHGQETPAFCNYFIKRGYSVIKSLPVSEHGLVLDPKDYPQVNYFLLDSVVEGKSGGTGQPFLWSAIHDFNVPDLANKMFLAGGASTGEQKDPYKS